MERRSDTVSSKIIPLSHAAQRNKNKLLTTLEKGQHIRKIIDNSQPSRTPVYRDYCNLRVKVCLGIFL